MLLPGARWGVGGEALPTSCRRFALSFRISDTSLRGCICTVATIHHSSPAIGISHATNKYLSREVAPIMHNNRPCHKRRRRTDTVVGGQLPAIWPKARASRAAAERHCCRTWNLSSQLALCVVTFLLLVPSTSAAAAGELPKPDTAHCIGDKENPGKFGCAEAGWTSGAIRRNLGKRQRVEGSEAEKRMVVMTMVKTEKYYDEEVPLMPKEIQENW